VQRGEALGDQILVGRKGVVRQRFPVGQQTHACLGREKADFLRQTLRVNGAFADDRQSGTFSR
jgi:hypothetical protein